MVDALDEARMRVSGSSWKEFIDSLSHVASRGHHFVFFGRERVLEDLWVDLFDRGIGVDWLEISHFSPEQRIQYVDSQVAVYRDLQGETEMYRSTRDAILEALTSAVDEEYSDSFVGYAPVLDAAVALLKRDNLLNTKNAFSGRREDGRISALTSMLQHLLEREQLKTEPLASQLGLPPEATYSPEEQLHWLASELMGTESPPLAWCPEERREDYVTHISESLRDHPFRSEMRWASPVFSAYAAAQRFDDIEMRDRLGDVAAATGLLFDFVAAKNERLLLDEWQFAALHGSALASEWREVEASVQLEGPDPSFASSAGDYSSVEGSLVLADLGTLREKLEFDLVTDEPNQLNLLGPLTSLSVAFPAEVVIRSPSVSASLGPDCYIRCARLRIDGETVQISRRSNSSEGHKPPEFSGPSVVLEVTERFDCGGTLTGKPSVDSFELRLPNEHRLTYPWVNYRSDLEEPVAPPNERAVRFLKMLMNLTRSHGHKGAKAVFDKKLEGRQSIKGTDFQKVIASLCDIGVLSLDGPMIFLESEWEHKRFSGKERQGVITLDDFMEEWRPVLAEIASVISR